MFVTDTQRKTFAYTNIVTTSHFSVSIEAMNTILSTPILFCRLGIVLLIPGLYLMFHSNCTCQSCSCYFCACLLLLRNDGHMCARGVRCTVSRTFAAHVRHMCNAATTLQAMSSLNHRKPLLTTKNVILTNVSQNKNI